MVFPMEVQSGSVIVKIYKVENKGRDSFTVSYFADGKRKLKMFADFDEAHAEAKSKAVHHAYSKHAEVTVPSLDDWEKQWKKDPQEMQKPKLVPVDFQAPVGEAAGVPEPAMARG
jgi:predicted metalloprotease